MLVTLKDQMLQKIISNGLSRCEKGFAISELFMFQ